LKQKTITLVGRDVDTAMRELQSESEWLGLDVRIIERPQPHRWEPVVIMLLAAFAVVGFAYADVQNRKASTPSLVVCAMNTFEPADDPLLGPGRALASNDCNIGSFTGKPVRVLQLD